MSRKIIIDRELFERFPDFKRGIVVVSDISNRLEDENIAKLLHGAVDDRVRSDSSGSELIEAWDAVHAAFGSNPNKFPPSIKSLLKRVRKGGKLPFINSVVALFNYISVKHLVPCGGDDLDAIEGNLRLGFASGNERFVPLGGGDQEHPKAGEVIYYDDETLNVMCRRWNWRNGDFSKITERSKRMIINVDGAGATPRSLVEEARDELAQLLIDKCNATLAVDYMDKENREIEIAT
jgi:lysyl-tRNA synthetase class 2